MSPEEQFEILRDFFSEETVESFFNHLPQDSLDEVLQVMDLVTRKIENYRKRIKELEG